MRRRARDSALNCRHRLVSRSSKPQARRARQRACMKLSEVNRHDDQQQRYGSPRCLRVLRLSVLALFVCLWATLQHCNTATLLLFSPWLCLLCRSVARSLEAPFVAWHPRRLLPQVRESQLALALNISPRLGWTVFTDTPHAAQPSQPLEDSLLALRRPQTPAVKL